MNNVYSILEKWGKSGENRLGPNLKSRQVEGFLHGYEFYALKYYVQRIINVTHTINSVRSNIFLNSYNNFVTIFWYIKVKLTVKYFAYNNLTFCCSFHDRRKKFAVFLAGCRSGMKHTTRPGSDLSARPPIGAQFGATFHTAISTRVTELSRYLRKEQVYVCIKRNASTCYE